MVPSVETHIFLSTYHVEFKTGFGEIVEFRPSGTKAKNHVLGGNLHNEVVFFNNEKTFPI